MGDYQTLHLDTKLWKDGACITVLHFTVGYFIMSIKSYPKMSVKQTLASIWDEQYNQRHSGINQCDRRITHLSDTDIFFALFNLFTYFLVHFGW
jgi:hypothetical protein